MSIIDASLRQYTLRVRVFHFFHLRYQVRLFHEQRMRVPSRADHVHVLRPPLELFDYLRGVQHLVADGVVDLVQDHKVVLAAVDRLSPRFPTLFRQSDVFRVRFRPADLYKSSPHWPDLKPFVAQHFRGIELAVVPRAFDELHHQDAQALPHRAKGCPECAGRFSLAGPGVNDQQSFVIRHVFLQAEPFHQRLPNQPYVLERHLMQRLLRRSLRVLQHDPQPRPVHLVVAWANGPRQLRNLELRSAREAQVHQVRSARQRRRIGRQIRQNTARIVHQISESLRHQESVDVSRGRLFYLLQVVVRQRFHQRYFDRHRWLVLVRYHSYAHRFPRSFHHGNSEKPTEEKAR